MPSRSRAGVLALLCTAFVAAGCTPADEPVAYTTLSFERTLEECPGQSRPCATVSLSYPDITRAGSAAVVDSLNRGILRPLLQSIDIEGSRESPEALAEELFFYYSKTVREFPDYAARWYIERSAQIALDSLGILSVEFSDNTYTGGAHPLHQQYLHLYDTRTGAPLPVDSLLAEGGREPLVALGEREFRRVRAIAPESKLNEAGFWFQGNRFALGQNIGLTRRGLEIIFNPYEIAPYAMGSTRLVLPYDSLQAVLELSRRSR